MSLGYSRLSFVDRLGPQRLERAAIRSAQLLGVGGFYVASLIFFSLQAPNFMTSQNMVNILSNASVIAIVSIGQALVLISGGFDLSVSGTLPLGGIIYTEAANHGHGVLVSTLLAVLTGLTVGLANGLIITKIQINPLVTTLATLSITGGLAFTVSNGLTVTLNDVNDAPLGNDFAGMPLWVWTAIILSVVAFLLLRYTIFGRKVYAIGGNREATRLAGLRTDALTTGVYMISGALASFAGVVLVHQLLAGAPTVGGDAALKSIAAVILGGASLSGGTGGIPGTLLGVMVLGTVANGMALMQIPVFYQQIATGGILLLAVGLARVRGLVERAVWNRPQHDEGRGTNQGSDLTANAVHLSGGES
jgi:ribose transport system permease protein